MEKSSSDEYDDGGLLYIGEYGYWCLVWILAWIVFTVGVVIPAGTQDIGSELEVEEASNGKEALVDFQSSKGSSKYQV